jgi:uncharacterized membrane protein
MTLLRLAIGYLFWHYTRAFADIFRIWKDFFWFCLYFFSVSDVICTLFSPWKRMKEEGKQGSIEGFFSALIVNTLMRIVGFFMRLFLLIIAVVSLIIIFIFGMCVFVIWFFAPLIIITAFVFGVILIFK